MRVVDSFDVSRGLRLTLVGCLLTRMVPKYLVEESVERLQVFRFSRALVSRCVRGFMHNQTKTKNCETVKCRPIARNPAEFFHENRRATQFYVLGVSFVGFPRALCMFFSRPNRKSSKHLVEVERYCFSSAEIMLHRNRTALKQNADD